MGLLFRDINVLSAPNNSRNFTNVTVQRDPERGDDRPSRGSKHHRHHKHHGHKAKHHCR